MSEREFWMIIRQALLLAIDAIERRHKAAFRTKVARDSYKNMVK